MIRIVTNGYSSVRRTFVALAFLSLCVCAVEAQAQSLPADWATIDVGSPALTGSATYANGSYTVAGAGVDVQGTSDQFRFVYRQLTGDGVIVARVATLQKTHVWSKAGVMIRETLSGGSKNAFMLVSAAKGLASTQRSATGGTTVTAKGNAAVPYWVKLERKASSVTASASRDGVAWTQAITLDDAPNRHGYAYPAIIQTRDGKVHVTYTFNREKIKHVVLDPAML